MVKERHRSEKKRGGGGSPREPLRVTFMLWDGEERKKTKIDSGGKDGRVSACIKPSWKGEGKKGGRHGRGFPGPSCAKKI